MPQADFFQHLFQIIGDFWDKDDMGPSRNPGFQGNPASIPAHDFQNHDPLVALSGGLQSIQRVTGYLHSGLVTEGVVRTLQIVIDCFGDANHRHPSFKKLVTQSQSSIPTHHKQAIQTETSEIFDRLLGIILSCQMAVFVELTVFKRIAFIGGPENGSTQRQYVPGSGHSKFSVPVKDQALEALLNAYDFCPVTDNR